jgi:hypothetical protein
MPTPQKGEDIDTVQYSSIVVGMSRPSPKPNAQACHCLFCGNPMTAHQVAYNICPCGFAAGPYDNGIGHHRDRRQKAPRFNRDGSPIRP